MDSQSVSQRGDSQKCKTQKRRTWSALEERCLVNALRDLVHAGMKCDNGFRSGFLGTLEKAMAKSFPGTDLKGDPHIQSKIHVWKKAYGTLSTLLSRTGIGWHDATNNIDVEDDQVWKTYVEVYYLFLNVIYEYIRHGLKAITTYYSSFRLILQPVT